MARRVKALATIKVRRRALDSQDPLGEPIEPTHEPQSVLDSSKFPQSGSLGLGRLWGASSAACKLERTLTRHVSLRPYSLPGKYEQVTSFF